MRHMLFSPVSNFRAVILIKETSFDLDNINAYYMHNLYRHGLKAEDFYAVTLAYRNNKVTASQAKSYLLDILPTISTLKTEYVYCADATYFKTLTNSKKTEEAVGYVMPCVLQGYEHLKIIYGVNYSSLMYNPSLQEKMELTLETFASTMTGNKQLATLGQDIIKFAEYPVMYSQIDDWLKKLHQYPVLVVDIEAFSLSFDKAGIGTISFTWSESEGIAFLVDYEPIITNAIAGVYGKQIDNQPIKLLLKQFFENYQGKLIAHNANYDFKVLVYELWMNDFLDRKGMIQGINILTRLFDDTALLAYLALNTTAEFSKSLKSLAHAYTGKYAQEEIKNICKIHPTELLKYNLIDGLATHYVFNKYYPIVVRDQQEELYQGLFKDSVKLILQMELVGMSMSIAKIAEAKAYMIKHASAQYNILAKSHWINEAILTIRENKWKEKNSKLKKTTRDLSEFDNITFNIDSDDHLRVLLYSPDHMALPVLEKTDTGLASTGGKILKALLKHTESVSKKETLTALIELSKVSKILNTFIPAFENGIVKADGMIYLHGSFHIGGTVSGRLSSSNPNMQNIPSGSTYGKLIKSCFVAPKGWRMVYADYSSLEDRISALLTKDPNKIKIYTDGYCGHCLRAYNYFPDLMPDIDPNSVESINSIQYHPVYKAYRQDSKAPTFLLTYQGTWVGMMKNCGFSKEKAKKIETNYHYMYQVSDEYIQAETDKAAKQGYATVAFGLRIRTAIIHSVLKDSRKTPYAAHKERKTLGNAMGQSYGLLNNRSTVAFMKTVAESQYAEDIYCVSMIHDASYFLVRDTVEVIKFVNDNLIPEMYWQDDPAIAHDEVGLGGELDICFSGWHDTLTVPNNSTYEEIQAIYDEGMKNV